MSYGHRYYHVKPTIKPTVNLFRICTTAGLAASFARGGHWLESVRYANQAVKAGMWGYFGKAVRNDVGHTSMLLCRWHGDEAAGREEYAKPDAALYVVAFWEAISAAAWRPDEDEWTADTAGLAGALAAGRILRERPRDLIALAAFRRNHAALSARVRDLDNL